MHGTNDDWALTPAAGADGAWEAVVFSDREVIAHGIVGLLPESWRDGARIVSDVAGFEQLAGAVRVTIVDAETVDALEIASLTVRGGALLILLLAPGRDAVDPALLALSDAVLARDEVDPLTLRLAVTAGSLGMRLLPRALVPTIGVGGAGGAGFDTRSPDSLGEPAQRALQLLADGMRDAEIAIELNLSESAARKVIQRGVRRLGARTRSQAVAIAVRAGEV
jgi:DNA-binding NarL/FixJ family response regulator